MFERLRQLWAARKRRRRAEILLDHLFAVPNDVLAQGRLRPKHRGRIHLLEIEDDDEGQISRLLLGIVRHPRTHPLAPRGEEVLELLEYRPDEGTLENVGGANLARRGTTPGTAPDA